MTTDQDLQVPQGFQVQLVQLAPKVILDLKVLLVFKDFQDPLDDMVHEEFLENQELMESKEAVENVDYKDEQERLELMDQLVSQVFKDLLDSKENVDLVDQ